MIPSAAFSDIKENMIELLEKEEKTEIGADKPRRICFICTGNTCRSPMAAAVVNAMIQESNPTADGWGTAFSRGLYANDGAPISDGALHALEYFQIKVHSKNDYRKHIAKTVSEEDICEAELIVAMTPSHLMELLMRFPAAAGKMTAMPCPISDPYGGTSLVYEQALKEIITGVNGLLLGGDQ